MTEEEAYQRIVERGAFAGMNPPKLYERKVELAEGVTLYQGDCLAVLPTLGKFDAVVTDPPYGVERLSKPASRIMEKFGGAAVSWDVRPSDDAINAIRSAAPVQIIWGGNYFDLPPTRAPIVWDKNNAGRDFADFEMAWTNLDMVARRFVFRPMNMDGGKLHPTQKPVEVMNWCVGFLPDRQRIVDPFMGSGTTGVSCVKRGHSFTGIEIDPGYFDIACKRIEAALREPDMFVEPPKPAQQLSLHEAIE